MDPIAEIRERFERYPEADVEEAGEWIRYVPSLKTGFSVEFHLDVDRYVVAYEGWHEHFQDAEEALDCFAFGLSDSCRLKTMLRGGSEHKWTVETLQDGAWVSHSETGLMFYRFWCAPQTTVRQNRLICAADAATR